ncbi:MAG: hypothetical protein ACR2FU_00920 [Streptosporangiaceae bacterium]
MPVTVAAAAFLTGALISLAASWVLVSRLERAGERLGLSEARQARVPGCRGGTSPRQVGHPCCPDGQPGGGAPSAWR